MSETASRAVSLFGAPKPYHERARRALPILVRQATAGETIEYGELAHELGMPNARNLNYPLGAIGQTMLDLSERWDEKVPPIQALVVNKAHGLPGEGVALFTPDAKSFAAATNAQRRLIVKGMLLQVFTYPHWDRVLDTLDVEPAVPVELPSADEMPAFAQGGEGEDHKALKELVAETPSLVGAGSMAVRTEAPLRSGDCVDVLFWNERRVIAVEVKGERSGLKDVLRGLFQCEKYEAVLQAEDNVEGRRRDIEVVLVLGDKLPESLRSVTHTLNRTVIDGVTMV